MMNAEKIKEIADEMEQYAEAIRANLKNFSVSMLDTGFLIYAVSDASAAERIDDTVYAEAKNVLRIFKAIKKTVDACGLIASIGNTEDFNEMMELVDDLEKELKEENNNE